MQDITNTSLHVQNAIRHFVITNPLTNQVDPAARALKRQAPCYRKRVSASYIVREVQSVRERERESETEVVRRKQRDGSDVTIVALKLAINLHFPCQKIAHIVFPFTSLPSRRSREMEVTSPLSR